VAIQHSASTNPSFAVFRRPRLHLIVLGAILCLGVVIGFAPEAKAATQPISGNQEWGKTTIPAGTTLEFDPNQDTTLTMTGNLIIEGTLVMKPANGNVTHKIVFTGFNENAFVGGGMSPIDSDVGLWVVGNGRIVLEGEQKPAWSYTYQSSWAGDEVRAAPNTPGNYSNFPQVTSTPAKNALGHPTELLNLTRNVVIQGTTNAYTHIFIRSTRASSIKNALFRYMAPDFGGSDVTGRYGLHFHHNGSGSNGTVVDGVVIRDTKGHAFVPHESTGITFKNVIAYNVRGEAYWWDPGDTATGILFDRAVAANVRGANGGENHTLGAFYLGIGANVSVTNSVVVGMQRETGANRSGYIWPEDDEATWLFKGNTAHNNQVNGIFVWQNNEDKHVIEDFTAYYNGQSGIEHGAYTNSYVYNGLTLLDNGTAIHSHANGKPGSGGWTDTQVWANVVTHGGTLFVDEREGSPDRPVRFVDCDLGNVVVRDTGGNQPSAYDFIRCGLEPGDFDLSGAKSNSVFRVQRANGTAYRITKSGVTSIAAFYTDKAIPGSGFSDVGASVFSSDIQWIADRGITKGCNPPANTRFCPNDYVTRGQMAAFITRALGLANPGTGNYFVDTAASVFKTDIDKIRVAGVTKGCNPPTNNKYCPDKRVTRGQMAAFMARAFGLNNSGSGNYFKDTADSVFKTDIDKIRVAGITTGCNPPANTLFCPSEYVTRGQMAAFLHRALS
jgi:hypothetical protein